MSNFMPTDTKTYKKLEENPFKKIQYTKLPQKKQNPNNHIAIQICNYFPQRKLQS